MFQQHPELLRAFVVERHAELRQQAHELRFHRLARRQRREQRRQQQQ